MQDQIRTYLLSLLLTGLLMTCGAPTSDTAQSDDNELPAKAPQERTEALDERQTEWSQSTYAEEPVSDSLRKEISDTSAIKEEY
ncbi:MAG TPA: hypothetical protein VJ953_10460 [Saprospiraceae bacterium]|nr:hypothetical protein [Saprospiraceae bacterium]